MSIWFQSEGKNSSYLAQNSELAFANFQETVTINDFGLSQSTAEDVSKDNAEEEMKEAEGQISRDDWALILINKQHLIPSDYEVELGSIKGGLKCDSRIIDSLRNMLEAAQKDGITLSIRSPYRDLNRQNMLFNKKVKGFLKKNDTYLEAYRQSAQAVTLPGASEHQIGLALDITTNTYAYLDEGFADTDGGKWLSENAYLYGFILRYPKGKEDITGIEFEPWHYRFVGVEAAKRMKAEDLCLEEFVRTL